LPTIPRLPGVALLLRVSWIERRDCRPANVGGQLEKSVP